ncbi:fructose-2,6-bisphosphatase [Stutzerimonas tarimensis]|uniref:Fructose-2,6-bisphosphatase n=1 Tax=Stutzerimonas tarimensis TaxID=1507735 RepID=A0ABV7T7V6_9GAMM
MAISTPRQIILVRHGRPQHSNPGWCTPAEMKGWIENYNRAEVARSELPPDLIEQARHCGTVVSSSVSRCVQSRQYLVSERPCESDELFAEAHLPYLDWAWPRAPSLLWRFLFRLAWFAGFARHTEAVAASDRRARVAADRLIELAERHGSVMLIGHGVMNILIARHLRGRGWKGPTLLYLHDYWQVSSYREDVRR